MQKRHDTQMLEEMVKSVSARINSPAQQVSEASNRLSREVEATSGTKITAADAQAKQTVLRAEGTKNLINMAAVSLVILALGITTKMVLSALPDQVIEAMTTPAITTPVPAAATPTPADTAPVPATNWPPAFIPEPNQLEAGVITTNFSLFREKTVRIGSKNYDVVAGHEFASETDNMFSEAWCYTKITKDGLNLEIELGNLEPKKVAEITKTSEAMLMKTGLSTADIQKLFDSCPWMDKNPYIQITGVNPDVFKFNEEVTSDSVDRLIAAVHNGAKTIEFNSPGGLLDEAIRGFEVIQKAGVKTVATGGCESACSLLFLGGSERFVARSGKIGVHRWATDEGNADEVEAQMMSAKMLEITKSAGVSSDFYIAGARTPASDMYYLTHADLIDWGVIKLVS